LHGHEIIWKVKHQLQSCAGRGRPSKASLWWPNRWNVRASETLGLFSVEDFLEPEEIRQVLMLVEEHKYYVPYSELHQTERSKSVHSVPGVSLTDAMKAYEPAGRVELTPLPETINKILTNAVQRALPAVQRVFPTASGSEAWTYLEYGEGQHITAHIDHPIEVQPLVDSSHHSPGAVADIVIPEPGAHVAGISIVLDGRYSGGEFFVETSASPRLWRQDRPELANEGADYTSSWFPPIKRTRWHARPAAGSAVLYGSQLIHGTEPVSSGVVRKVIGFLTQ
jgi:hypothetical protein